MARPCFKSQAPGSLMLMGEYAVLHGFNALVAAIDQRIEVRVYPRQDKQFNVHSALGDISGDIQDIPGHQNLSYVLHTLQSQSLTTGVDIDIESAFSGQQGLGSSAAVTVALLAALYQLQQKPMQRLSLYHDALNIIQQVQGQGSGADVAASIFGGIVEYCPKPLLIRPFFHKLPLVVIYSGKKTQTSHALQLMKKRQQQDPQKFQQLFQRLGELSHAAKTTLLGNNLAKLGELMQRAQKILVELGVSTEAINKIIDKLIEQSTIYGAKISGSGLGDCVIALGHTQGLKDFSQLFINLSNRGVS